MAIETLETSASCRVVRISGDFEVRHSVDRRIAYLHIDGPLGSTVVAVPDYRAREVCRAIFAALNMK